MSTVLNRVRKGFYMDSVALMRLSQALLAEPGVENAALMIGSNTNKALMRESGLLTGDGEAAGANDLILALKADDAARAGAALDAAEEKLAQPAAQSGGAIAWQPKSLRAAMETLPGANLALVSVPGEFAAAEARRALRCGLHVMMFSDNVPIADERALKEDARQRGRLLMGPDCGTAIIGGAPLGFANAVPRGPVGLISASGTGLQEVSALIARHGGGISEAIGVGGRDLSVDVGGITTLMAIDLLDQDDRTERIVLISKPPAPEVAKVVLDRVGQSRKHFTICFIGLAEMDLPPNASLAATLKAAAEDALGGVTIGAEFSSAGLPQPRAGRGRVRGLFAGGTLCAEAQLVFRAAGTAVASNAPVPGVARSGESDAAIHTLIDLGADEYTRGRPHPMIDPAVRRGVLDAALADEDVTVILLDVVIGYGAHANPAGDVAEAVRAAGADRPAVVASVCGTDQDPQNYTAQVGILEEAGVHVAPSNAQAADAALAIAQRAT